MVHFFIKRPIAVLMVYLSVIIPGFLALLNLPVSLMPDVDIPQIKVYVTYNQALSREMENNVVRQLRTKLLQSSNIENINSETENGQAVLKLKFKYGTDINLAYIECNEKIDAATRYFPKDMDRPIVIKASATDIPVFSVNLSQKEENTEQTFLELSEFARSVVKRRIEQIPEVAFVDISGYSEPEIQITPNLKTMANYGIRLRDLDNILKINNINYGSLSLNNGQYTYIIQFENKLKQINDIANLSLTIDNRIIKLSNIAQIKQQTAKRKGIFLKKQKEAISMRVIMQNSAQISQLEEKVKKSIDTFSKSYPNLEFEVSQDNSKLLKYSISNLSQTLLFGILLAFIFMFLFLGNLKLSLIAGISIPTALLISFLFFYFFEVSINIISLSGLILGVGLMIDNAIIVIDNISGHRKNNNIADACIIGTEEIIRPLLSSVLTTLAVFFPLVFLSGISGALFFDQALAVGLGLISSLIVSISLLPVLYNLFISEKTKFHNYTKKIEILYKKGFEIIFAHKKIALLMFLSFSLVSIFLFQKIEKQQMPTIQQNDFLIKTNWNENISLQESENRIQNLLKETDKNSKISNTYLGSQQFLFNNEQKQSFNQFSIYIEVKNNEKISEVKKTLSKIMKEKYPKANFEFQKTKNAFEYIFPSESGNIVIENSSSKSIESPTIKEFEPFYKKITTLKTKAELSKPSIENYFQIRLLSEKLLIYKVSPNDVFNQLQSLLESMPAGSLKSLNRYVPIVIKAKKENLSEMLNTNFVLNQEKESISLSHLIEIKSKTSFKKIFANNHSEYIPVQVNTKEPEAFLSEIKQIAQNEPNLYLNFSGSFFSNKVLINELSLILLISLALLYFILAAQFESIWLPLIILIELPIDIGGALLLLYLAGYSLNLMSAIGIVVMSGIIINDSILKLDAINQFQNKGFSLKESIEKGGEKRLNSILMTSLTTIFALLPLLFFSGLGADLQKPFALAVIGGLSLGTIISLYFIPLIYWFISINSKPNKIFFFKN